MAHPGFAFINIISPCVTFNNNKGSTKSYDFVREHMDATGAVDFIPEKEEITTSYRAGSTTDVQLHDGSWLKFHKLSGAWNPLDRLSAMQALHQARTENHILTGLLFLDQEKEDLHQMIKTAKTPLNALKERDLCPGSGVLKDINASLR